MTQEEMKVLQGMFEAERKHTAQMMDEKLTAERKNTAQLFEASENRMAQMMDEKLTAQETRMEKKLNSVKAEVVRVERELKVLIEDNHTDIFNFLREDYSRIEGNAAKGAEVAKSYDEVVSTQADHTRAIQKHNERITALEEKVV